MPPHHCTCSPPRPPPLTPPHHCYCSPPDRMTHMVLGQIGITTVIIFYGNCQMHEPGFQFLSRSKLLTNSHKVYLKNPPCYIYTSWHPEVMTLNYIYVGLCECNWSKNELCSATTTYDHFILHLCRVWLLVYSQIVRPLNPAPMSSLITRVPEIYAVFIAVASITVMLRMSSLITRVLESYAVCLSLRHLSRQCCTVTHPPEVVNTSAYTRKYI